jgi:hypothetical protein
MHWHPTLVTPMSSSPHHSSREHQVPRRASSAHSPTTANSNYVGFFTVTTGVRAGRAEAARSADPSTSQPGRRRGRSHARRSHHRVPDTNRPRARPGYSMAAPVSPCVRSVSSARRSPPAYSTPGAWIVPFAALILLSIPPVRDNRHASSA